MESATDPHGVRPAAQPPVEVLGVQRLRLVEPASADGPPVQADSKEPSV
jgi:hypothetical protein